MVPDGAEQAQDHCKLCPQSSPHCSCSPCPHNHKKTLQAPQFPQPKNGQKMSLLKNAEKIIYFIHHQYAGNLQDESYQCLLKG